MAWPQMIPEPLCEKRVGINAKRGRRRMRWHWSVCGALLRTFWSCVCWLYLLLKPYQNIPKLPGVVFHHPWNKSGSNSLWGFFSDASCIWSAEVWGLYSLDSRRGRSRRVWIGEVIGIYYGNIFYLSSVRHHPNHLHLPSFGFKVVGTADEPLPQGLCTDILTNGWGTDPPLSQIFLCQDTGLLPLYQRRVFPSVPLPW